MTGGGGGGGGGNRPGDGSGWVERGEREMWGGGG